MTNFILVDVKEYVYIFSVLDVEPAIPIVMGANMGTSVTNTIVSLAQAAERAFAGVTVHDIFNWLSVLIYLPLEVIAHYLVETLLKKLTELLSKIIIQLDKKIKEKMTLGHKSESKSLIKDCSPRVFGFFLLPAAVFGLSLAGWQIFWGVFSVLLFLFIVIVNIFQRKAPDHLPEVLQDWEWLPKWTRSLEPYGCVFSKVTELSRMCHSDRTRQASNTESRV